MTDSPAAGVYAQALIEATEGLAPTVADEIDALARIAGESPEAWAALTAPDLSSEQRIAALERLYAQGQQVTRNFLKVLVERGRLEELPAIAAAFRELVKQRENQLDVRVTTAIELPAELRSRLEERLSASTGKQVQLHTAVDPAIIGGLVVQHGDTLVDTSLRGRLENLRLALQRGTLRGSTSSS